MKKIKKALAIVLILALCIIPLGVMAVEGVPYLIIDSDKNSQAVIMVSENISPKEIEDFVQENNLIVQEIRTISIVDGETYTTGYVTLGTTDIVELADRFATSYYKILCDSIVAYQDNPKMLQMFEARKMDYLKSGIYIHAFVISFDSKDMEISSFTENSLVQDIEIIHNYNADCSDASPYVATASDWVPTQGGASVWNSSQYDNAVYMSLNWRWATASALSTLTSSSNSTLESEIVFYNYDGLAHSDKWCTDEWTYDTNQPRPYMDTQFNWGNLDEVPFTIGCSDASLFTANKDYYWALFGNKNNAAGSKAKIYFQRGHRIASGIYESAWNVLGDETVTVVPFSSWNTGTQSSLTFTH